MCDRHNIRNVVIMLCLIRVTVSKSFVLQPHSVRRLVVGFITRWRRCNGTHPSSVQTVMKSRAKALRNDWQVWCGIFWGAYLPNSNLCFVIFGKNYGVLRVAWSWAWLAGRTHSKLNRAWDVLFYFSVSVSGWDSSGSFDFLLQAQ